MRFPPPASPFNIRGEKNPVLDLCTKIEARAAATATAAYPGWLEVSFVARKCWGDHAVQRQRVHSVGGVGGGDHTVKRHGRDHAMVGLLLQLQLRPNLTRGQSQSHQRVSGGRGDKWQREDKGWRSSYQPPHLCFPFHLPPCLCFPYHSGCGKEGGKGRQI